MSVEVWKDIKGYEGRYMASSLGRIKSIKKDSEIIMSLIKGSKKSRGCKIKLYKNGSYKTMNVCTVISNTFLGRKDGQITRHINGDINDNRVENLFLLDII